MVTTLWWLSCARLIETESSAPCKKIVSASNRHVITRMFPLSRPPLAVGAIALLDQGAIVFDQIMSDRKALKRDPATREAFNLLYGKPEPRSKNTVPESEHERRIDFTLNSCRGRCGKHRDHEGVKLMQCGRCNSAPYCSKECQKRDWPRHKSAECAVYAGVAQALAAMDAKPMASDPENLDANVARMTEALSAVVSPSQVSRADLEDVTRKMLQLAVVRDAIKKRDAM
jgi:hypothetical protein